MEERNKAVKFSQKQKGYMLRTLWDKFFENIFRDYLSLNEHAHKRLSEIRDAAIELLDNREDVSESLLEYIEANENIIYVIVPKEDTDKSLNIIKDVCPSAQRGISIDIFLGRYGRACKYLYGG